MTGVLVVATSKFTKLDVRSMSGTKQNQQSQRLRANVELQSVAMVGSMPFHPGHLVDHMSATVDRVLTGQPQKPLTCHDV